MFPWTNTADVDPVRARYSHLSAGVSGHRRRSLPRASQIRAGCRGSGLLQPAIRQAREGIVVSYDLSLLLKLRQKRLCRYDAACGYFYKAGGVAYEPGELLQQEDLATTLGQNRGTRSPTRFTRGAVAAKNRRRDAARRRPDRRRFAGGPIGRRSVRSFAAATAASTSSTMPPPSFGRRAPGTDAECDGTLRRRRHGGGAAPTACTCWRRCRGRRTRIARCISATRTSTRSRSPG